MRYVWLTVLAVVAGLAVLAWSNDSITLEDRWTLYTARCADGTWQGKRCTGHLIAAEWHRFRTDEATSEVSFQVVGEHASSGRLSRCAVEDGRNWSCPDSGGGVRPIIYQLARGEPLDPAEGPGHARLVSKRKWLLLRLRLPVRSEALA